MKYLTSKDLRKYQVRAIKTIFKKKKVALFFEMSGGKTVITLASIKYFIINKYIKKTLIVAPINVCNNVWKEEAEKWDFAKNLTFVNLSGGKIKFKKINIDADIYLINPESVHLITKDYYNKFDMLVIDESSCFKSHGSNRFKSLKKWSSKCKSVILLSGTPSPNSLLDLWSQYYLLDSGERLGKYFTHFKRNFFIENMYNRSIIPINPDDIYAKVNDITLKMGSNDNLELPEVLYHNIYCDFIDKNIYQQYKALEKDLLLVLDSQEIDAKNRAVLFGKLLQFCNGSIYDENKDIVFIHSYKIDLLKDIIKINNNKNILIAYSYRHELLALQKAFKEAVVFDKNPSLVKDWNKGLIKILLAHPASAGHGLNLQLGGSIIIWHGATPNLEHYKQFNARLIRYGQKHTTKIYNLIFRDCIDDKVVNNILKRKDVNQSAFFNSLKDSL